MSTVARPETDVVVTRRSLRALVRQSFAGVKPEQVAAILRELDRGQLRRWSDLCAALLGDPVVRRGYAARRAAIASRPVDVRPAVTEGPDARAAQAAADYARRLVDDVPDLEAVVMRQLDAVGVGVAAHQVYWTRSRGEWMPRFVPVPTRECWWDDDLTLAVAGERGERVRTADYPARFWVTVPAVQPGSPTDQGDFRSVVWFWLFKVMGWRFWLTASERYGTPLMLARLAATATPETREEVLDDLARLSASSYGVIGGDASIEVHDAKGAASAEMWRAMIAELDRAILLTLAGSPDVFLAGPDGSRAATETRASVAREVSQADARVLWGTFLRDVVAYGLAFNGLGGAPLPTIETQFEGTTSEPIYAYHLVGKIVRRNEIRARLGLPPLSPEEGGDELLDAVPAGAQPSAMSETEMVGGPNVGTPTVGGPTIAPPGGAAPARPFRDSASQDGMPTLRRTATTTSPTSSRWRRRVSAR